MAALSTESGICPVAGIRPEVGTAGDNALLKEVQDRRWTHRRPASADLGILGGYIEATLDLH
jgi:hypothetical protein